MTDTMIFEKSVSNLIEIAQGFEKRKKYELAEQVFHAAKTFIEPTLGTTHALYMDCLLHLAFCNQKLGRSASARDAVIHYMELLNLTVADVHSDGRWIQAFHLLEGLSC
jgi:hypothetical protein